MSNTKKIASVTIAAIVGLGLAAASGAAAAAGPKEKCYGVVKKGKNDCGNSMHACAGQAKKDNHPEEWLYVSKGICDRIGGTTK